MIRTDRFLLSHRPYAVDLTSLARNQYSIGDGPWKVTAVWFRRRRGVTVACYGHLWDYQDTEPADAAAFLTAHDDGRYGGDCQVRWDGDTLWTDGKIAHVDAESLLDRLLRPMLANYPAIPAGFDGWYEFSRQ